jgi:hypothetical protein
VKRLILAAVAILLLSACPVAADLIVDAGTWNLQPNKADQEIYVSISGDGNVTYATVAEEIVGVSPLPRFTGGDILNGTIFTGNNSGEPTYDFSDLHVAYLSVETLSGAVDGNGILAKMIVSTDGVFSGDFVLNLLGVSREAEVANTSVGTIPAVPVACNAGTIHVASPGDTNLDGTTDQDDLTILLNNYDCPGDWGKGDFNNNETVDNEDLGIFLAGYGKAIATGDSVRSLALFSTIAPVPEPSSLVLLVIAAAGAAGCACLKRWNKGRAAAV